MVFQIFAYVYTTLVNEIAETSQVFKEIFFFHSQSLFEKYESKRIKKQLIKKMKKAKNYAEWKSYAEEFDNLKDLKAWKENTHSNHYDYEYVIKLKDEFRRARESDNHLLMIHLVRTHAVRGIAGINHPQLYKTCYLSTKNAIQEFYKEFILSLEYIAALPPSKIPHVKKLEFFAETRHAFGRTALLLSGGAGLGFYHFGVLKILYEERLMPRIITGSSVGSIMASAIGVKPMDEIDRCFKPGYYDFKAFYNPKKKKTFWGKVVRLITEGYFMDSSVIKDFLVDNIGDITFQEAYDQTGWILNITVTGSGDHDRYKVCNYLTSPNVIVWSAVLASCAIPFYFQPCELYCKNERNEIVKYEAGGRKYIDGSMGADLPRQKISEFFNVNNFLVSQVNPWVIPFMNSSENIRHTKKKYIIQILETIKDFVLSELAHRAWQLARIGLLPSLFNKGLNLFYQNYTGDITIWPAPKLMDYLNLLSVIFSPTDEYIQRYIHMGEQRVYPKLAEIKATLEIEKALEIIYNKVKNSKYELNKAVYDYISPSIKSEEDSESVASSPEKKPKTDNVGRQSLFSVPRNSIFDVDPKMHKFFTQKSRENEIDQIKEEQYHENEDKI